MISSGAAGEIGTRNSLAFCNRAADQFLRTGPVKPHSALRCIHRFRNPETKAPKVMAESHCRIPINGWTTLGMNIFERV